MLSRDPPPEARCSAAIAVAERKQARYAGADSYFPLLWIGRLDWSGRLLLGDTSRLARAQIGRYRDDRNVAKAIARRAPAGGEKRSCGPRQRHARDWANAQVASPALACPVGAAARTRNEKEPRDPGAYESSSGRAFSRTVGARATAVRSVCRLAPVGAQIRTTVSPNQVDAAPKTLDNHARLATSGDESAVPDCARAMRLGPGSSGGARAPRRTPRPPWGRTASRRNDAAQRARLHRSSLCGRRGPLSSR
jgi:hypothetical protein